MWKVNLPSSGLSEETGKSEGIYPKGFPLLRTRPYTFLLQGSSLTILCSVPSCLLPFLGSVSGPETDQGVPQDLTGNVKSQGRWRSVSLWLVSYDSYGNPPTLLYLRTHETRFSPRVTGSSQDSFKIQHFSLDKSSCSFRSPYRDCT